MERQVRIGMLGGLSLVLLSTVLALNIPSGAIGSSAQASEHVRVEQYYKRGPSGFCDSNGECGGDLSFGIGKVTTPVGASHVDIVVTVSFQYRTAGDEGGLAAYGERNFHIIPGASMTPARVLLSSNGARTSTTLTFLKLDVPGDGATYYFSLGAGTAHELKKATSFTTHSLVSVIDVWPAGSH